VSFRGGMFRFSSSRFGRNQKKKKRFGKYFCVVCRSNGRMTDRLHESQSVYRETKKEALTTTDRKDFLHSLSYCVLANHPAKGTTTLFLSKLQCHLVILLYGIILLLVSEQCLYPIWRPVFNVEAESWSAVCL